MSEKEKKESLHAARTIRRTIHSLAEDATEEERLLLQRRITVVGYELALDPSWSAFGWERRSLILHSHL